MDYVEHLRNSEAYDNTVLIVMSDHGYNGSLGQSGEATWMRQCALLLIKGRNEHHDTMQISQAPISFEDLQEAYVRLLDGRRSDESLTGRKAMQENAGSYGILSWMTIICRSIYRRGMLLIWIP